MLPKIDQPQYTLRLPHSNFTVTYRPFLVKEEKILLLASQGNDQVEITRSIRQVVNNCITTPVEAMTVKFDDLPAFEVDYLFLNMRAKSIGDKVEQEFTCNNVVNDKPCDHVFPVELSVSDVMVTKGPKDSKIMLSAKMGVKMKYPKFKTYDVEDANVEFDMLVDCMDSVFDDQQSYSFRDQTKEEIEAWIGELTKEQFNKLQEYYDSLPRLELQKKFKCPKCGFDHEMKLEDPISFF